MNRVYVSMVLVNLVSIEQIDDVGILSVGHEFHRPDN
jgi:hypothetical protein